MKAKINLRFVVTEKGFHKKLAVALDFPKYYGNNLDALFDVLTERSNPLQIEFLNWRFFALRHKDFMQKLNRVFANARQEGAPLSVEFL